MNPGIVVLIVLLVALVLFLLCVWFTPFRKFFLGTGRAIAWFFYFFFFWWWYATLRKMMGKTYPKPWPFSNKIK